MTATRLLRRLREHDWLAAAIEFVIVVAGILLALQVSNWNPDRVDRERGARFALRLEAELASDLHSMDEAIGFWEQVGAYGKGAMAHSEDGALVGNKDAAKLLETYRASTTLLEHLREWMSTLRISAIVVASMRADAKALADALKRTAVSP
jgi:hypothetical protein